MTALMIANTPEAMETLVRYPLSLWPDHIENRDFLAVKKQGMSIGRALLGTDLYRGAGSKVAHVESIFDVVRMQTYPPSLARADHATDFSSFRPKGVGRVAQSAAAAGLLCKPSRGPSGGVAPRRP